MICYLFNYLPIIAFGGFTTTGIQHIKSFMSFFPRLVVSKLQMSEQIVLSAKLVFTRG